MSALCLVHSRGDYVCIVEVLSESDQNLHRAVFRLRTKVHRNNESMGGGLVDVAMSSDGPSQWSGTFWGSRLNPNLVPYIYHISPNLGTHTFDGVRELCIGTYLVSDKLTKLDQMT